MTTPYINERIASYNVATDGSIIISTYLLEDDIDTTAISTVTLEIIPPTSWEIKGIVPTAGWSSYSYTGDPIYYAISVPAVSGESTDVEFQCEIVNPATGATHIVDPKFTVKNTTSRD